MNEKLCLEMKINCMYAQQCLHCYNDYTCPKNTKRCGSHKNCFQCKIKELKHDEILPCEVNLPNDSELTITDKDEQIQVLKNALELAERENKKLKATLKTLRSCDNCRSLEHCSTASKDGEPAIYYCEGWRRIPETWETENNKYSYYW